MIDDDPALALLRLVSRVQRLEALPRTGWIVSGVPAPESIAAHIYMVTVIALWLADHIDEDVDAELVMRMALLHDLGEAMLTDLPSPVKRFMGKEVVAQAEARAADIILQDSAPSWGPHFHAYEDRSTLEARIVKAADRIQMLSMAAQYQAQGRGDTSRFWGYAPNFDDFGIPLVADIFTHLRRFHQDASWFPSDFD